MQPSNVNSRQTIHLLLVIVNIYLEGKNRPAILEVRSLALTGLITPFGSSILLREYNDRDTTICSSGLNLRWLKTVSDTFLEELR